MTKVLVNIDLILWRVATIEKANWQCQFLYFSLVDLKVKLTSHCTLSKSMAPEPSAKSAVVLSSFYLL